MSPATIRSAEAGKGDVVKKVLDVETLGEEQTPCATCGKDISEGDEFVAEPEPNYGLGAVVFVHTHCSVSNGYRLRWPGVGSGLQVEQIAQVAHEANRGYQAVLNSDSIPVAASWDDLSTEMKDSIIQRVKDILCGQSPEESHEAWLDYKTSYGWVYGEVKDEVAKTHPCIVPFDELPVADQVKDYLFSAIVLTLGG